MIAYRLLQARTQPEFQDVPEPHAGPGQVATDAGITTYSAIKMALPGIWPGSTAVVIGIGGLVTAHGSTSPMEP